MSTPLRLVYPGEKATGAPTRPPGIHPPGITDDTPVSALTAGQLVRLIAGAVMPSSPYDRLTPDEVRAELRVSKTSYHKLVRANVLRQLRDETAGVVFVTRSELDRYKRETGTRTGPIANTPGPYAARRRRAA